MEHNPRLRDALQADEKLAEEYITWRYNSSFLYDYMGCTSLQTPSITLDWSEATFSDPNFPAIDRQLCLLGTCYSTSKLKPKNRLKLVSVPLPPKKSASNEDEEDQPVTADAGSAQIFKKRPDEESKYEGFAFPGHLNYKNYMAHNEGLYRHDSGEVNRARFNPSDQTICATSGCDGKLRLYKLYNDLQEISDGKMRNQHIDPIATLDAHDDQNWCISWSTFHTNRILSCGADSKVVIWDLNTASKIATTQEPFEFRVDCQEFNKPPGAATWLGNDVFCSADEDGHLKLFDLRDHYQLVGDAKVSLEGLNAVDRHPTLDYIVATGGDDKLIRIVDIRLMNRPQMHLISHHEGAIQEVQFNRQMPNLLASGCSDGVVGIFDIANIGKEISAVEEMDGPSELLFQHCGHVSQIQDISWNPLGKQRGWPYLIGTVAEDATLQSWQLDPETLPQNVFHGVLDKVENYQKYLSSWKLVM